MEIFYKRPFIGGPHFILFIIAGADLILLVPVDIGCHLFPLPVRLGRGEKKCKQGKGYYPDRRSIDINHISHNRLL
jgi:hypothetical protein